MLVSLPPLKAGLDVIPLAEGALLSLKSKFGTWEAEGGGLQAPVQPQQLSKDLSQLKGLGVYLGGTVPLASIPRIIKNNSLGVSPDCAFNEGQFL